jgi:quercetin dioxygenase-like cupin family protein
VEDKIEMAAIRHVRLDRSQGTPATNPIFVGPVSIQEVVNDTHAEVLRVTAVTFENGAVNRPHRHTTDQVLVATSGSGFVATDEERLPLNPGDVAFIPSGTRHWHGANPGATFTHLSILTPGHTEILGDAPD